MIGWAAWPGLFFALLQSVCTFFAALDGLRLLIGVTSLAVSAGVGQTLDAIHSDWIRVPMVAFAVVGSFLNLVVVWQVRRLRARPSARWRQRGVSSKALRSEWIQVTLSIVTLILVAIEERQHFLWARHF